MSVDCCADEQTLSTFGQVVAKCQSWIFSFLEGNILSDNYGDQISSGSESTEDVDNDRQNIIVSVLFLLHIAVVVFFLARHCSPRGAPGGASYY
jgi:hypothetical protein